jgi:subtilase family serine protease
MAFRRSMAALVCASSALVFTACGGAAGGDLTGGESSLSGNSHRPVCGGPAAGDDARCHAWVRTDQNGTPAASATPRGYGPNDLQTAYNLLQAAANNGSSQTIAIVDAYGYPSAEADLGVYRAQFGLPPCTTANGCFRKVDQRGGTKYPKTNCGWAQETALDLDMASAMCPNCKIVLVQADSASMPNLGAAVDTAVSLGATVVSNSYGGPESSNDLSSNSHYRHPGVAITVSSGDSGYGVQYPAASPYVTAVGGTNLKKNADGTFTETAWNGAGSGCSSYEPKQSWQTDLGCSNRTVADVSAVADPNTGVAVYDSLRCQGAAGWMVFGGTSVAAPVIAGVYALAGNASSASYPASLAYSNAGSLNDVTSGSNGSCGNSYLCTAGAGYDGPTGLGTPNGVGAF